MNHLTTVAEVVEDIIENMTEVDKDTLLNTDEEDLIQFHNG